LGEFKPGRVRGVPGLLKKRPPFAELHGVHND
jgi:hypothetical protein